jgi:hypothetical protein
LFTSTFNSLNDMMPADAFGWCFDGSGRKVAAVAAPVKQSEGYETGDRSMLRHGKPPFPQPMTVRQGNGGVVQRQIQLNERQGQNIPLNVVGQISA